MHEVEPLSPSLKALHDKALAALKMANNDYAIQLAQNVLKERPDFLDARVIARKAAIAKKSATKKLLSINTAGLSVMKIQPKVKKDPTGAMADLEVVLADDPFNVQANQLLFEAAKAKNWNDVASFALEIVRQGHPKNTKVMHQLAEHYMINKQSQKAIGVYQTIVDADPTDGDARRGVTNASAQMSVEKQGWEKDQKDKGYSSLAKDTKEAKSLEMQARQGMTDDQKREMLDYLFTEYAENQENVVTVRKIAETYESLNQIPESLEYYKYALALSPGDSALETKVHRLEDKILEKQIQELSDWVDSSPTHPEVEEQRAILAQLVAAREESLITTARERVERNPTDPQLRFELGSHLFAAGHATEAIPELQKAKSNPHIRTKALLMLARCYDFKNMSDLAERVLIEANSELRAMDDTKKEILYTLGLILEKGGKRPESLDCFKQIYEVDYGYKDVARRVEQSYGG